MTVYDTMPEKCPATRAAVALGMFDGLHRGHLAVLDALRAGTSGNTGEAPCVFTFSTERGKPDSKTVGQLISRRMRDGILEDMGIRYVFQPEFSDFKDMPPELFARDFLLGYLNAGTVFCGEDFRFGRNAAAGAADLRELLAGMADVRIIPMLRVNGGAVSTTRIRALIREGDMRTAAELLGRAFTVDFPVERGRMLGRTLDAPTINQVLPGGFVIPRFGVYASVTRIDGRRYPSVTNVGVKPTVGSERVVAETYIQGFSGDLYGREVPVELVDFIRDERKFPDLGELKKQIEKDAEKAAEMIGG